MESSASAVPAPQQAPSVGPRVEKHSARQGPQVERRRHALQRRHRRSLDSTRLQPCRHPGPGDGGRRDRSQEPGHHDRVVHSDDSDREFVLLPEQSRSRLRHHVQLGDTRDGPEDRLGHRLGDGGCRHHRHGQSGADHGHLLLPAVRPGQSGELAVLGHRRGCRVPRHHVRHHGDRHRGVGATAVGLARLRVPDAGDLLGRRAGEGLYGESGSDWLGASGRSAGSSPT